MTAGPGQDAPRAGAEADAPGFTDALTYAFADPVADVYGVARLGLADGAASGLALVFRGGEAAAVHADSGVAVPEPSWEAVTAAGLRTRTDTPGVAWTVAFDGDEEAFDLRFEAVSPALELTPDAPAARAGGMAGHEHVCRVSGAVGATRVRGLGQRSRSWGTPDWERMALTRTVTAWTGTEHAVSLVAVRHAGAESHADEAVSAWVFDADREDTPVRAVDDPRLSTTYDGEGRQRRAGLELYVGADDPFPRRAAGELVAGTSVDLGRLRLDCAFFRWRMEGREGAGRFDVLRRAS